MNTAETLELVTFKANSGVTADQMVAAALAVTPLLRNYDGFISRSFAAADGGTWIDAVYWRDRAAAEHAAKVVMQAPVAQAYFALIDQESMVFKHADIATQSKGAEADL
ncbi:MAG: hypothetical protein WC807_12200 [Hyphomicrobium sp.]|jgi:hypothetical protein